MSDGDDPNLWQTPLATDTNSRIRFPGRPGGGQPNLCWQVDRWPTPSVADGTGGHACRGGARSNELLLNGAVKVWPTPMAADADKQSPATRLGSHGSHTLVSATSAWPTPRAADGAHMPANPSECTARRVANGEANLGEAVVEAPGLWATPKARDFRSGGTDPDINAEFMERRPSVDSIDLPPQVVQVELAKNENKTLASGTLNPAWVEILMGWPIGWTDPVNPCPGIWPGWPAGMGPNQFTFEPPRIAPKGSVPNRAARVKACGNGVVPQQAALALSIIFDVAAPFLQEVHP